MQIPKLEHILSSGKREAFLYFLSYRQRFYFLLAASKILLFSLVFSIKGLGGSGGDGVRVLFRVCRTSWIHGLVFFFVFGKTWVIFSSSPYSFLLVSFPPLLPEPQ